MNKIIVANWKMNPQTFAEAVELTFSVIETVKEQKNTKVVLCPPFVWLTDLSHKYKNDISFGAQDVFWEDSGAYTGEISPQMLLSSGVKYVIVGHSERRWLMGETDEMINKKLKTGIRNGLLPILAIGERNKGDDREEILALQLNADLNGVDPSGVIIAYEPVWAIGSGESETPEHSLEAVGIIKKITGDIPVLYGGSVDSQNVGGFISKSEMAGVLIGGASVDKEEFKKIIEIVSNV